MSYWSDRQAQAQQKLTSKNIKDIEKQLEKYYYSTMKRVIADFESTYEKLLSTIADGKQPTPADLYKLDRYWQLQGQLKEELEKLGNRQAALLSKKFVEEYADIYRALEIKDDLFFGEISEETVRQMINQIWCADGKSWSSRVWANIDKLQETLNDNLIHCVLTGKKTSELKEMLMNDFGVSYSRADTIVRTEMAHIQTQAAQQRYMNYGIQEVEIWADYDERRCDVCGSLHKKRYPVCATMPIPAHPNCRCCIIPVVEK